MTVSDKSERRLKGQQNAPFAGLENLGTLSSPPSPPSGLLLLLLLLLLVVVVEHSFTPAL